MLIGLALAMPCQAQIRPEPGTGDPRLQSVEYRADQVVLIEAALGFQVTIELAPDEQVQSVAVGDSSAWQVTANRAGNHLFVKPLQADAGTNMTVVTDVRLYAFDLAAGAGPSGAAYTIRFRYPTVQVGALPEGHAGPVEPAGRYKLTGARALRPARMIDDGIRTYIDWPADAPLPAVYMLDDTGRESLANGNMRSGVFVIDSVAKHLVFRIDKRVARADRRRVRTNAQ